MADAQRLDEDAVYVQERNAVNGFFVIKRRRGRNVPLFLYIYKKITVMINGKIDEGSMWATSRTIRDAISKGEARSRAAAEGARMRMDGKGMAQVQPVWNRPQAYSDMGIYSAGLGKASKEHFSASNMLGKMSNGSTYGFDSDDHKRNAEWLIGNVVNPLRDRFEFKINSGYRNQAKNREVGGSRTSSHMRGTAVDLGVSSREQGMDMIKYLVNSGINYNQIILEQENGYWVHLDVDPRSKGRRELLEKKRGSRTFNKLSI